MEQVGQRAVIEFGKRNLKAPNHWELLDLDDLHFTKPTVICLSGNGTVTNKGANGFAKQAETYLDLMFKNKDGNKTLDNVDIMGVKYVISQTTAIGGLDDKLYEQLSLAMLELLVDKEGNKFDLATAKKNMAQVTFFTYCAGNQELQNIIAKLNEKLALVGYSQKEIVAINQATLEVSFAPLSVNYNKIPSVRVISLKDSLMKTYLHAELQKLTGGQTPNFDGVALHEDEPGFLYGEASANSSAPSLQVLSTSLFNSSEEEIDEHLVRLTARDEDWNLKPSYRHGVEHRAGNADCVSQMMAWALCKGVENSIQNFQAATYVPNTYWHELTDDFQSIIDSYGQTKLAQNPVLMHNQRKAKFNRIRAKKKFSMVGNVNLPTYEEIVSRLNNAESWEDVVAYLQAQDFLGVEHVLPAVQVLTQPEKDAILKMAGITPTATTFDHTK